MVTDKTSSFTCSKTFYGGTKHSDGTIDDKKTYRFKVVKNQYGSFDCIPEYYSIESDKWVGGSHGWNVEEVFDSTGLYLNFGSNKVIVPTEDVWEEIRERLKSVHTIR